MISEDVDALYKKKFPRIEGVFAVSLATGEGLKVVHRIPLLNS